MSYRLKTTEAPAKGLVRVACQQIDNCLPVKTGEDGSRWVHDTRKSLKRTRALLRLFKPCLSKKDWRRENGALRDIGRALGDLRERNVLPVTAALLATGAGRDLKAALDRLTRAMTAKAASTGDSPAPRDRIAEVERDLRAARESLAELRCKSSMVEVLAIGLAAAHRRGRERVSAAMEQASDHNLHELRKAVQAHWRQMQLLEVVWPDIIGARVKAARDLSQALGDHQDLAVLAGYAAAGASGIAAKDRGRIVAACRERQARIRAEAVPAARRLFAADPEAFATEMVRVWRAADAQTRVRSASRSRQPAEPLRLAAARVEKGAARRTAASTAGAATGAKATGRPARAQRRAAARSRSARDAPKSH